MKKKILTGTLSGITILIFLFTLYIIISGTIAMRNNKPMSLFGFTYSVVPTESMEPEIKVGDIVIGYKTKYDKLEIGQTIIYWSEKYQIFIVHKIISGSSEDGFITQGINTKVAPNPDEEIITKDNYVSRKIYNCNPINLGNLIINNRWIAFLIIFLVFGSIFANEITNIIRLSIKKKHDEANEQILAQLKKEVQLELKNEKADSLKKINDEKAQKM